MNQLPNILDIASNLPLLYDDVEVMQDLERSVPGSVKYSIKRYRKQTNWNIEDTGVLVYHFNKNNAEENYLELRFCVSGNVYCRQKETECDFCKFNSSKTCIEKIESVDVLSFIYSPAYLQQFARQIKMMIH